MWPTPIDVGWDGPVWSHKAITLVEVWSAGVLVGTSDDIIDGDVTEKRATGVRGSLSLTVEANRQWLSWFKLPLLELRVFAGFSFGRTEFLCPLGVFPVSPPSLAVPQKTVSVTADDRWQIVGQNDLLYYWQGPAGKSTELAARLMRESGLDNEIVVTATKDTGAPALMWDKNRHDLIVGYLDPIGAEAFVDRTGQAVIQDRESSPGRDLSDGEGGTVIAASSTLDWSKAINAVGVVSTKTDVDLAPYVLTITDPFHPAHRSRIGDRSTRISSNTISNFGDQVNAATAALAKGSAPALSWTVECVPDPTRMPGDLVTLTVAGLDTVTGTVESVSHPLGKGTQKITLGAV
jgi:hypothetical protein